MVSLEHNGGRKWWELPLGCDGRRKRVILVRGQDGVMDFIRLVKTVVVGHSMTFFFLLLRDMLKGILMKYFSSKDEKKGRWMAGIWEERSGNTCAATVTEPSGRASRSWELAFSHREQCQPNTSPPHCFISELCSLCLHGKCFIYPTMSLSVSAWIVDSQNMVWKPFTFAFFSQLYSAFPRLHHTPLIFEVPSNTSS